MMSYDEMINDRMKNDEAFAAEMFKGAVTALIEGDLRYGLVTLRDIVKAGMGYAALSKAVGISVQNLRRTLSATGNPTIKTLNKIIEAVREFGRYEMPRYQFAG